MVFNVLLVACGIFLTGCGIWSAFAKKPPVDSVGAFFALSGFLTVLAGILMICVPGFFK